MASLNMIRQYGDDLRNDRILRRSDLDGMVRRTNPKGEIQNMTSARVIGCICRQETANQSSLWVD
jgi:hypothetical protein